MNDWNTGKALANARIVLEASCEARAGESLVILADEKIRPLADTLARAAVELGLMPMTVDITHYVGSPAYGRRQLVRPLVEAMRAADIVIANTRDVHDSNRADFSRLTGDRDLHDQTLTGQRRWVYLQCDGLDRWQITGEAVRQMRSATLALHRRLQSARSGRITTPAGTDLTFALGRESSCTPVLGIVPLYAEIAVVPGARGTSGVMVVDGPTQVDVRPSGEVDREPLRLEIEDGRVVSMAGDREQVERLRRFIASGNPPADAIDEVGILTTPFADNDRYYWSDGTHHHDRVHVALGNNVRRDAVIHGPKHMDGEMNLPTIWIDGQKITERGVFAGWPAD